MTPRHKQSPRTTALDRWQLQDAKAHFSSVVDAAVAGRPQCVSRHGKDAVVIISYQGFRKMTERRGSLVEFFRSSPLVGIKLNLHRRHDTARETDL